MIRRLFPGLMALAGLLLGSCYPVDETPPQRPRRRVHPGPPPAARAEPAITPARHEAPAITAAQPLPAASQAAVSPPAASQAAAAPVRKPAPAAPAKDATPAAPGRNLPIAQKAPGRDGFVLSPYTSKLILVRGIPSGTVVPDQTSPASPQKFFVVP